MAESARTGHFTPDPEHPNPACAECGLAWPCPHQRAGEVDPLVVDAVAWVLFADADASYLAGEHQPTDDEQELAALFVGSLQHRGYDVVPVQG